MLICFLVKHLRTPRFSFTCSRAFGRTTWLYSHYQTLDLPQNATQKQIKEAYFTLSKKYHPDLHPNDPKCHEKFIKLQEAYKVLSNTQTREEYDASFNNTSSKFSSHGSYSSQAQSQYYNQRPWSRPDYSKRDEWIRHERSKREQREKEFQEQFGKHEFHKFNKFYSRPHNLTPEEMEFLLNQRRFSKNNKAGLIFLGIVFLVFFLESVVSTRRKYTSNMFEVNRKLPHQSFGFNLPPVDSDDHYTDEHRFEDYLNRRSVRLDNPVLMYDDRDISEKPS